MRVGLLGASTVLASASVVAVACGVELAPAPSGGSQADSGGDSATAEPQETPLDEFACGPARCTVGTHVCCVPSGGGGACFFIADGCSAIPTDAGDASADAGPPPTTLACVTYRNCPFGDECCWSQVGGSTCKDQCNDDERGLCQRSTDGCGQESTCRSIDGDPLGPSIGECVRDQTSSSSGSGSNSSGWGW
jgi:hypothetical protein